MDEQERHDLLITLAASERFAEKAYDAMYDAHTPGDATGRYSDAKEAFYDAISAARKLGYDEEVKRLEARLDHVKAVFRKQFT